jgi:uncharacterized membrane protein YeaQ/YmgE (transglycosylase-associated protein family)
MAILVAILLIILVVAAFLIWSAVHFFGLILYLIVAGIVGWLADLVVPGRVPFGWLGAIVAGLVGSLIGALLFGRFGPDLAGIHIIPAFIGAVIFAFVVALISRALGRGRAYD